MRKWRGSGWPRWATRRPASQPQLDRIQPAPLPHLVDTFPEDSPHLAKARLLANAGLNEYIAQEIKADPNSSSWSALAEAQIYSSYGETFRAVRAIKRALPSAASASIQSIPLVYWRILFPEAWWDTIKTESARNHLDPYLVASLIRQESEFDPSAISYANAYGLMQLLPSVGRTMAREEGMTHFQTFQLLDPATNIRLGTRYLRQMLDRFGGVQEYALAAYNAGDSRVVDWQAAGPYSGIDEFVESIPFTQTREYVEAILRNEETYKAIDNFAHAHGCGRHSGVPVGLKLFHFGLKGAGESHLPLPGCRFALNLRRTHGNTEFDRNAFRSGVCSRSLLFRRQRSPAETNARLGTVNLGYISSARRERCQPTCSFWKSGSPKEWTRERFLCWRTRPSSARHRIPT